MDKLKAKEELSLVELREYLDGLSARIRDLETKLEIQTKGLDSRLGGLEFEFWAFRDKVYWNRVIQG